MQVKIYDSGQGVSIEYNSLACESSHEQSWARKNTAAATT